MSGDTYNIAVIRDLLLEALDPAQVKALAQEALHFAEVTARTRFTFERDFVQVPTRPGRSRTSASRNCQTTIATVGADLVPI